MLMDTESAFEVTDETTSSIDAKTVIIGVSALIIIFLLVLVFTLYNSNNQSIKTGILFDNQSLESGSELLEADIPSTSDKEK